MPKVLTLSSRGSRGAFAGSSKLGAWEDIERELRAFEGRAYGAVALLLRRPIRN